MSRLSELIDELCPDGVEYKKVGLIANYEQPSKYIVNSTNYSNDYNIPVLTAGQTFILGYTNEEKGIYPASKENPVIIFDDFTGAFKWVDFPFKVKSSAMKIITANDDVAFLRYIFYIMGYLNFTSNEHKRLWIGTYSEFEVPVPPLEVQREIVRILDKFTILSAELSAELSARRKQYVYYRDKLLTFDNSVECIPLSELANVFRGEYITQKDSRVGDIPVILGGQEPAYYIDKSNHDGEIVVVARSGVSAGFVSYWNEPIYVTDGFGYEAYNNKILPKYLYYALKRKEPELNAMKRGAGIPHVSGEMLSKVLLPVPEIAVQQKLIKVLDNFDSICSDLNIGLPAEIEARQKQYEFYRDQLLTFVETGKTILNGTERNGTERNGTERNGTERNGTERNGTERNGTA